MWEWTSVNKSSIGFLITATESETQQTVTFNVNKARFNKDEIVKTLQAKVDALKTISAAENSKLVTLQEAIDISGVE